MTQTAEKKEKIVILGGGVSAITAAFKLTSEANWQDKYQIDLYQMGWRIGGKGASGRNMADHARIEEHGIHVWFGFYYNAFQNMRACYDELNRPLDSPLARLDDAFKPHQYTAFAQEFNNEWTAWPLKTMALPGKVGEGWKPQTFMKLLADAVAWLLSHTGFKTKFPLTNKLIHGINVLLEKVGAKADHFAPLKSLHHELENYQEGESHKHPLIIDLIEAARSAIHVLTKPFVKHNIEVARLWMMMDFGLTALLGMMEDEVYDKGFDSINDINLKDWLFNHGASEMTLNGPIVASLYGGVFAYKNGELDKPDVETGTVLRAGLTAVSCSKESFIWRMEAGMGDVVFAPYYEVLKKRGVQFHYFHKVEEVLSNNTLSDPNKQISQIRLVQQVPLKNGITEYNPLVDVKGLPCWPSEPCYDQIQDDVAELLKAHHINLESNWTNWPDLYNQPEVILKAGTHFDKVILGISVAGLPAICPSLLLLDPAFKTMTENISTVATQAAQTWANKDVRQLGSTLFEAADEAPECLGYNPQAMDSWADVSYLNVREIWPADQMPQDISYFCGVFNNTPPPVGIDPDYPISQTKQVKADFIDMLEQRFHLWWPNANPTPGEFKWQWLIAPEEVSGPARFDAQYWRANVDPSERYVQTTVGTSQYRLKTDGSVFNNLFLTGDWINNGFNMGCVESATISGLKTAHAILGNKEEVIAGLINH